MEVSEAIKSRRSIRAYQDREVSREMIEQVVDAGQWAPTPSNCQSWRFVVVQERKRLNNLKAFTPGMLGDPPIAVVICSDRRDMADRGAKQIPSRRVAEASVAAQNMALMAHSLGLGTCLIASFSEMGLRELLELPDHIHPVLVVSLGYTAKTSWAPARKELSRILFWDKYEGG